MQLLVVATRSDAAGSPPPPLTSTSGLSTAVDVPLLSLFLPQHTVPQSSAGKSFWKRCQGLLENTLGSLKRKRKIYRQSANEVILRCVKPPVA